MTPSTFHVALITASVRTGRIGPAVTRWFGGQLESHTAFRPDPIDLADPADRDSGATERLGRADGFVIVTPEYNHSFPASLKEFIDGHKHPWQAKPVAVVSYGGLSGGVRATEHLRTVMAELHAVTLRDSVALPMVWEHRRDDGSFEAPPAAESAAKVLLDRLLWWTSALAEARARSPYAA
ncbi:MAG TPA: NAD(P)H-dependent oxidoreductase [Nocardioides sp.]|nr:NAD(P)H-dependent oxidoreductase [Nocardioides sp.]